MTDLDPVEAMVHGNLSAWPAGRPEEEIRLKRCHDEILAKVKQINVSFFAKVGNGKSSSANTLLQAWGYDGPGFEARRQREMVTTEIQTIEQEFKDPVEEMFTSVGGGYGAGSGENPFEEETQAAGGDADATGTNPFEGDAAEPAEGAGGEGELAAAAAEDKIKHVVLRVTDQPGLMDSSGNFIDVTDGIDQDQARALAGEHQNGYHVLFLVQKLEDRLDAGEQAILRVVRRFYGESVLRRIVLLLTYSDTIDTEEEITSIALEAKVDVSSAVGGDIGFCVPINNHKDRVDIMGKDRLKSGREMISVIHDIICSEELGPEPFIPEEVEFAAVVKYVEEEVQKHPNLKKDALLGAVLRFVPVKGKKKLCAIL